MWWFVVGMLCKQKTWYWRIGIYLKTQTYQLLERVYQILQVNIFPVSLQIGQEEIVDPLPNLALEHKCQHRSRKLQEEDEANDSRELKEKIKKQGENSKSSIWIEFVNFYVWEVTSNTL